MKTTERERWRWRRCYSAGGWALGERLHSHRTQNTEQARTYSVEYVNLRVAASCCWAPRHRQRERRYRA